MHRDSKKREISILFKTVIFYGFFYIPPYRNVDPKISIIMPIEVTVMIKTAIFFILYSLRLGIILN